MKIGIIGGGAAGFMAAITAARTNPNTEIFILEKSAHLLSKVRISGGGRCNITHRDLPHREFATHYPRGERQMPGLLHHFSPTDTLEWFERAGLRTKVEPDGRIFPVSDSSQSVIDCLMKEAENHKINIYTQSRVDAVSIDPEGKFCLSVKGRIILTDRLIISCGGFPKRHQYQWIMDLGHKIIDPVPSLFTFNLPDHKLNKLRGVAVSDISIHITGGKVLTTGPVMITHWGLSGPAVLKASAEAAIYFNQRTYHVDFTVNWLKDKKTSETNEFLKTFKEKNQNKACNKSPYETIPARLWLHLLDECAINTELSWQSVSYKQINILASCLTMSKYESQGVTRFKEEFVTAGGIDLKEIDLHTMQSLIIPGLYFAGEVINIDGVTGGFNFQNAWTTGYLAGINAAKSE